MLHGRTTESPSAKPWDCCYVSEDFNFTTIQFLLTPDETSLHNLPVSTSLNPDHILEHSEDDTKSLFVIIKVSFSFYSLYEMLLVYPAAGLQRSHRTLCLSGWLQIISDLMFFRGTQKKEFDSRWKSFTLVKKSMENRVSWKSTQTYWLFVSMSH